jgi:hypothetical protein
MPPPFGRLTGSPVGHCCERMPTLLLASRFYTLAVFLRRRMPLKVHPRRPLFDRLATPLLLGAQPTPTGDLSRSSLHGDSIPSLTAIIALGFLLVLRPPASRCHFGPGLVRAPAFPLGSFFLLPSWLTRNKENPEADDRGRCGQNPTTKRWQTRKVTA